MSEAPTNGSADLDPFFRGLMQQVAKIQKENAELRAKLEQEKEARAKAPVRWTVIAKNILNGNGKEMAPGGKVRVTGVGKSAFPTHFSPEEILKLFQPEAVKAGLDTLLAHFSEDNFDFESREKFEEMRMQLVRMVGQYENLV
jgi:hypothetical protein